MQQLHSVPVGSVTEDQIERALKNHFPNFEGISAQQVLNKLENQFQFPLTSVEFERQIKNAGSAVSQALFVCVILINDEQARLAMNQQASQLAALKDNTQDLRKTSHEFIPQILQVEDGIQQLDDHLQNKHKILQYVEIQTKLLENYFKRISEYKLMNSLLSVQLRQQKQDDVKLFNKLAETHGIKTLRFTPAVHAKLDRAAEKLAEQFDLNSPAFAVSFQQEFDNTFGKFIDDRKDTFKEDFQAFSTYKHEFRRLKFNQVRAYQPIQLQMKSGVSRINQLEQESMQLGSQVMNLSQQINFSSYDIFNRISGMHSFLDQLENLKRQQQTYSQPTMQMGMGYSS